MKKNANESGVETAHSDAGTEAGNVFSRVIMGGMACPSAASTLPNGMVFDPDVNKIIGPVRGFNSFALWILVLWSIWTGIMRMIRA